MAATATRLSLYVPDICCYLPRVFTTRYSLFINESIVSFARGQFSVARVLHGTHSAQE